MKQNNYRLARLVFNLLDITKLGAGFMEPKWEKLNIIELLANIVESTGIYIKQKNLDIIFHHTAAEKLMLTDSFFLERIMLNLLSNGIKHTPPGGKITVACSIFNDKVAISVKDSGEGIPDNKKEIIYI
jgi:signal transduction histidine kinase